MMEIQPEAKPIYLIGLDTSAQYDRKQNPRFVLFLKLQVHGWPRVDFYSTGWCFSEIWNSFVSLNFKGNTNIVWIEPDDI